MTQAGPELAVFGIEIDLGVDRVHHKLRTLRRRIAGRQFTAQPVGQPARQGRQFLHDLRNALDQPGSVADEPVAALRERIVDRPGHGEYLASLLGTQARGDQRATA